MRNRKYTAVFGATVVVCAGLVWAEDPPPPPDVPVYPLSFSLTGFVQGTKSGKVNGEAEDLAAIFARSLTGKQLINLAQGFEPNRVVPSNIVLGITCQDDAPSKLVVFDKGTSSTSGMGELAMVGFLDVTDDVDQETVVGKAPDQQPVESREEFLATLNLLSAGGDENSLDDGKLHVQGTAVYATSVAGMNTYGDCPKFLMVNSISGFVDFTFSDVKKGIDSAPVHMIVKTEHIIGFGKSIGQTAGFESCSVNPTSPICSNQVDCNDPTEGRTNPQCVCPNNPRDPICSGYDSGGGLVGVPAEDGSEFSSL